jgi:hypothetical protein
MKPNRISGLKHWIIGYTDHETIEILPENYTHDQYRIIGVSLKETFTRFLKDRYNNSPTFDVTEGYINGHTYLEVNYHNSQFIDITWWIYS